MWAHGGKWMYLTHLYTSNIYLNMLLETILHSLLNFCTLCKWGTYHFSYQSLFREFCIVNIEIVSPPIAKVRNTYCPYNNVFFWNPLFFIAVHYKRFSFPKLQVLLMKCNPLYMQRSSRSLHITLWKLKLSESVQKCWYSRNYYCWE